MKIHKATEIHVAGDCQHVAYHEIMFPDVGEDHFYRSAMALNAFFSGIKKPGVRERNSFKPGYLFVLTTADDGKHGFAYVNTDAPTHVHKSIKDFFAFIGYDQKTKRQKIADPEQESEQAPRPRIGM